MRAVYVHIPQALVPLFDARVCFDLGNQLKVCTVAGTGCDLEEVRIVFAAYSEVKPEYHIKIDYMGVFSVVFTPILQSDDDLYPNELYWARQMMAGWDRYLEANTLLKATLTDKKLIIGCEYLPDLILGENF